MIMQSSFRLDNCKYYNKNITTYNEGIYKKPVSNIMKYDKEETDNIEVKENEKIENKPENKIEEKPVKDETTIKSQILNFKSE